MVALVLMNMSSDEIRIEKSNPCTRSKDIC